MLSGSLRASMTLPLQSSLIEPDFEVETAMEADEALTFEPEEGADSTDLLHEGVKFFQD